MHRRSFLIAGSIVTLGAWPALAQNTNGPELQKWYQELVNKQGGSCCGAGDAYPCNIDIEATSKLSGTAHVIDPSAKEIWVKGMLIKTRPAITGPLNFEFYWHQVTLEKFGNPTSHAIAFLNVSPEGTIVSVYCVVPLPPGA